MYVYMHAGHQKRTCVHKDFLIKSQLLHFPLFGSEAATEISWIKAIVLLLQC